MGVVEVVFAVLEVDAEGADFFFSDECWVDVASADIRKRTDVTDDFAK